MEQYHEEKDGSRTSILLGTYNQDKHIAWLESNPTKRPRAVAGRKQISHMYTDGSHCELTSNTHKNTALYDHRRHLFLHCSLDSPRRVEVKLKCKEMAPQQDQQQQPFVYSMNLVSLYLLEPQPCEYILGVEAPFLCPLIEAADANALIQLDDIKFTRKTAPTPEV